MMPKYFTHLLLDSTMSRSEVGVQRVTLTSYNRCFSNNISRLSFSTVTIYTNVNQSGQKDEVMTFNMAKSQLPNKTLVDHCSL